ncbi:type II toxin-antitoxin system PemK/MazF family toxin [Phragmitibacter flavus]|uniref:Type II toxin-antitoxin system PemK/MazF family toxin n=2 Tax=Phragmitibacter flavus TaxID=2576071 RepID=A0A5R8KGU5_9BACT|nr:type II toxin-antitoxin system PemK/MazF family toxin [Phragmitibacter flavus]
MIQKVRPVLVLSVSYKEQERALISYVIRTTSLRGTEYEVEHVAPRFLPGAFDVQSIGTVPDVVLVRRLAACDATTLEKVENGLKRWLGIR